MLLAKRRLTCVLLALSPLCGVPAFGSDDSTESVSGLCSKAIEHYRASQYAESTSILKNCLKKEIAKPQPNSEHLLTLYRNLSVVLRGWQRPAEAAEYDCMAQKLEEKIRPAQPKPVLAPQVKRPGNSKFAGSYKSVSCELPFKPLCGTEQSLLGARKKDVEPERLAQYERVEDLLGRDNPDEALKEVEKGREKYPDDGYFLVAMGKCKNRQQCRTPNNKCDSEKPAMSPALEKFAKSYGALGSKYNQAVDAWQKSADDLSTPNIPDMSGHAKDLSGSLGDLMREMSGAE